MAVGGQVLKMTTLPKHKLRHPSPANSEFLVQPLIHQLRCKQVKFHGFKRPLTDNVSEEAVEAR